MGKSQYSARFMPFDALRKPIRKAVLASLVLNLLSLATPLYMMVIYDRVMTSRSGATLLTITLATVAMLGLLAVFDMFRNIVFARASARFYAELEGRVLAGCRRWALAGGSVRRARPLEDLEAVRSFLGSATPGALFDIVFAPLFIAAMFSIHPALGTATLIFLIAIICLALLNKKAMARHAERTTEHFRKACDFAEMHWREVEPSMVMGYAARGESLVADANRRAIMAQVLAASTTGGVTSVIKGTKQASQILIIALAALLAIEGAVSMGAIIASSILFARALSPIDQLIGAWRLLFQTRAAWFRLQEILDQPEQPPAMALAPPKGALIVDGVVAAAPGSSTPILKGISFTLQAGDTLGIMGPSGSGKSTLAKAMLGVWPAMRGTVRLDGADIGQLNLDLIGQHLGYVPQAVQLLPGTVAENIRRLGPDDPDGVLDAAERAGAHEMILKLPNGYDTLIGQRGFSLSGGQLQRIGLARALYGRPRLVILDEPEADLDQVGERALIRAIATLRSEGTTLVVIAHRPALLHSLDKLLLISGGQLINFGPTAELLGSVTSSTVRAVQ